MENKVKKIRILTIFILIFLLSNLTNNIFINVSATDEADQTPGWYKGGPYNPDSGPVINFFANQIYKLLFGFNIGAGKAPKFFYAEPETVEIEYLQNTTVNLIWGTDREERNNWQRLQADVFPELTLRYEAIFPTNIPKSAFRAIFEPATFDIADYHEAVGGNDARAQQPTTKMTLYLDLPPDPENTIQDFILQIDVSIYRKYGDLINKFGLLGTIFGGFLKANYQADVGHKSFYIFVKVKPFRDAEIFVPEVIQLGSMDMKSVSIQVQNRGSHIEQFGLRCTSKHDNIFVNTPGPFILLPGESSSVNLGIVTKPKFYDHGTFHEIDIQVYPHDEPNSIIAVSNLSVFTKGYNIGGLINFKTNPINVFYILILLFLLSLSIKYYIRRRDHFITRPNKPWTIPEEKEFLKSLIKQHREEDYRTAIIFMKLEYQSSLMWYKSYKKNYKH